MANGSVVDVQKYVIYKLRPCQREAELDKQRHSAAREARQIDLLNIYKCHTASDKIAERSGPRKGHCSTPRLRQEQEKGRGWNNANGVSEE